MVISHDGAWLLSYVFTATQALLCLTLSHRIDFHGCPSAYLSLFSVRESYFKALLRNFVFPGISFLNIRFILIPS